MYIEKVNKEIDRQREILLNHSLYNKIKSPRHLQIFMENHIFAVWDFMSLLKALQIKLTCVNVPWQPSKFPQTRYLINEIVLAEESDVSYSGERLSHFEMYLQAMNSLEASRFNIDELLKNLENGLSISQSIAKNDMTQAAKDFLEFTFDTVLNGEPHEIAAAFTFGREDLIPSMFTSILSELQANFPNSNLQELIYYFDRHIELDADQHGPMALEMIRELAQEDKIKWQQIIQISKTALDKRIALWDSIESQLS